MSINDLFNETELTIFTRQTGFTFSAFFRSSDGIICAIDKQSGQIFMGADLFRSNVHPLDSISSVSRENNDKVKVSFCNVSPVEMTFDESTVETLLSELAGQAEKPVSQDTDESIPQATLSLSDLELNEVHSRLLNSGRLSAISYLMKEIGASAEDSRKYVDEIAGEEVVSEHTAVSEYNRDGTMTREAILATVKRLRFNDNIHVDFKPWIGKLREFNGNFEKLEIDVTSRYFSLSQSGNDYQSLMDTVADELFENIELVFFCKEKASEVSLPLKRITVLKIV